MTVTSTFEVIIIGGSYSGLAAGMALGRAMRNVLIIDSGKPCNRQTPHSHNLITQDGKSPAAIAALAKQQVENYSTVKFFNSLATIGKKVEDGFEIQTASGESFRANKIIFATGVMDILPDISGFNECWGISVIHCPYCHGYEVRNQRTGIFSNGEFGFEFAKLILNWTRDLTLFTNGPSTLTAEQAGSLEKHQIKIVQNPVVRLEHVDGLLQRIVFRDGTNFSVKALYAPGAFQQHCKIPETLGCGLTEDGYIKIDAFHKTTVSGLFACGDNVTRMRTLANVIAMGTTTGMMVNRELIAENF